MREMVDPYTSRSVRLECAEYIKGKYDRENLKRGFEGHIKGSCPGGKLKRTRVPDQNSNQIHGQVRVLEVPKIAQ